MMVAETMDTFGAVAEPAARSEQQTDRKRSSRSFRAGVGAAGSCLAWARLPRTDGRLADPELDAQLLRELGAAPSRRDD